MAQFKNLVAIFILSVFLHGLSKSSATDPDSTKTACGIHTGKPEDPNDPEPIVVICDNIGADGRTLDDVLNKEPLLDATHSHNPPKYPIDKVGRRVSTLYVTSRGTLNIPKGTFSNLVELEQLELSGEQSGGSANLSIFKDELSNLPHLQILRIRQLALSSDAVEALKSTTNRLNEISISRSTPNRAFLNLLPQFANLSVLTLIDVHDETPEDTKDTSAFGKSAGKLEYIILNGANITKLQKSLLHGLVNLKDLRIVNSSVQEVEPGAFDDLQNLEVVYLIHNKLSSLPSGLFDKNTKLKKVALYNNYNITNISPTNFTNHKNFEKLELKETKLKPL